MRGRAAPPHPGIYRVTTSLDNYAHNNSSGRFIQLRTPGRTSKEKKKIRKTFPVNS